MIQGENVIEVFEREFRAAVEALIELGDVEMRARVEEPEAGWWARIFGGDGDGTVVETNWNEADSSVPSYATAEPFQDVSIQPTNRWLGVTAFGLLGVGAGLLGSSPALMLAGTIGIAYTVYARLTAVPATDALVVTRDLDVDTPTPGDEVEVTVRIRNEGRSMLPDLRFVDAVPDAFVVTDGVPRLHTALQSGAEAAITYTVRVERGEYRWPLLTVARDFAGNVERASLLTPAAELQCIPSLTIHTDVPVRDQTVQYAGDVDTETGGAGLELHSVRE
jgi:uncharacterized protein (DUF58 family)